MAEIEYRMMAELEESLWWYKNLHKLVIKALSDFTVRKDAQILDLGCGTGGVLAALHKDGFFNARGTDISEVALRICQERGLNATYGDLADLSTIASVSQDIVISNDVLIIFPVEKHATILNEIKRILKPAGLLVMNLPAHAAFSGTHDLAVGINQRIEVNEFEKLLKDSGFTLLRSFGWPLILSPVILITRFIQRLQIKYFNLTTFSSDVRPINSLLNRIFYMVTSLENILPLVLREFGSSQFFVCKK
jgi:SAM-dependent methyltransferase